MLKLARDSRRKAMNKDEEDEAIPEAEQIAKLDEFDELKVAAKKMMIAINIKRLEATPGRNE